MFLKENGSKLSQADCEDSLTGGPQGKAILPHADPSWLIPSSSSIGLLDFVVDSHVFNRCWF